MTALDPWRAALRALPAPPAPPVTRYAPGANLSAPPQPERARLILGLLVDGLSYGAVAWRLGVTRGVVAGVAHRARARGWARP